MNKVHRKIGSFPARYRFTKKKTFQKCLNFVPKKYRNFSISIWIFYLEARFYRLYRKNGSFPVSILSYNKNISKLILIKFLKCRKSTVIIVSIIVNRKKR